MVASGSIVVGLYVLGIFQFGFFHMIDYLFVLGAALYICLARLKDPRINGLRLPVLYGSVGFSLCWVALEKLFFPELSMSVLEKLPVLPSLMPVGTILVVFAFVEFTLGYMLIINLFKRELSLFVSVIFFSTSTIFGKTEVAGHMLIHFCLLIFIIAGSGTVYRAPIEFYNKKVAKLLFVSLSFIGLFVGMGYLYCARTIGA
ncbi:MAG: hypothetical protein ACI9BD_000076 [Candidatus Marinamargulisbacteria bacterium]|jgi:hypothetical protein